MTFRSFGLGVRGYTTTQLTDIETKYGVTGTVEAWAIRPGTLVRDTTTGQMKVYDGAGTWQVGTNYTPPAAPVNTVLPVITGTLTVGSTLTTSTGTWTGTPAPTYTYQWYVNDVLQVGATNSTFTAVAGSVKVSVTATNVIGTSTVFSLPVTVV